MASAQFTDGDFRELKAIETRINHDVKAVELFLKEKLDLRYGQMVHFGLTSEDVTNLAWSGLFQDYVLKAYLPLLDRLLHRLADLAAQWQHIPFPAHTHGQPASPTTAGKEVAVFLWRLLRQREKLSKFRFRGKLNGATGNLSAMIAAFPEYNWLTFSREFVASLDLEPNPVTTQVEDHDAWAELFNLVRAVNNIVLDLDRDFWLYISRSYFVQLRDEEQVGSSTMPHKVNPINFENSEGNIKLANALLRVLSDELCQSRLQRDLSDSTVTRNVGVAMAHSHLALQQTLRGLGKLELDAPRCLEELRAHPELLAEAYQTILRVEGLDDPYDLLRRGTQGRKVGRQVLQALVGKLPISDGARARLQQLDVPGYTGAAGQLVELVLDEAERVIPPEEQERF